MYGGKLIEHELLGDTKKEKAVFGELHSIESYMKHREAVEFVKSHQRGDPFNPSRFFPKSLVDGIKKDQEIGLSPGDQIAFYTAINSPLDRYHGVDAFFELKVGTKTVIVTIDVTTNPSKDRYKADVILAIPEEGLDPKDQDYKHNINNYVDQIRSNILTKI